MLQWTGGSCRKLRTSRKFAENRQKQYFEQRRRRQQTAHPQNFDGGTFRYVQQPKEHRSLDIQSLLNLSTIAAKRESAPIDGKSPSRDACLKVSAGKSTNVNILNDPVEHEGLGSSQINSETVTPKRGVNNTSNNQGKGSSDKMNHWNIFSEQNVSVLDLLDNEGIDRDSDFKPVNEDHVAFSVDDLGETGKETAIHLQWCPDRHFPYGFAFPSKNTSYLDLSRDTNRAPYESQHEMGSIIKDFNEAFSPTALGSTFCRGNAYSIPNQENVGFVDDVEYNLGHSSKNAFCCENSFSDIYNSNDDLWDAMTSIGENFFCERDFGVSRKHLGVDATYNNKIEYGYPGVHA